MKKPRYFIAGCLGITFFCTGACVSRHPDSAPPADTATADTLSRLLSGKDHRLSFEMSRISFWQSSIEDTLDSLDHLNYTFIRDLLATLNTHPQSMDYAFPELAKSMNICTSDDKKLKSYSWDTNMGGTMRDYQTVFQFRGYDTVGAYLATGDGENKGIYSCTKFYSFVHKGKVIYLAFLSAVYSTSLRYEAVKLFSIEGNRLNDTLALIQTAEGLKNEYGIVYNFFTLPDKTEDDLILFDPGKLSLRFPVIGEQESFTNAHELYTFDGQFFVKK